MFLQYYHIPHFNFICGLPEIYYATCFPLSFRRSNNIGIADYAGNRVDRTSNQHAVILFGHKLVISMAFKSFFSCETVPVTMLLYSRLRCNCFIYRTWPSPPCSRRCIVRSSRRARGRRRRTRRCSKWWSCCLTGRLTAGRRSWPAPPPSSPPTGSPGSTTSSGSSCSGHNQQQ